MEIILDFLVENYLWFLIISLILLFALIGYIVDTHEKKTPKLHFQKNEDNDMESIDVPEAKSLKEMLEENEQKANLNAEETIVPEVNKNELKMAEDKEVSDVDELPNE